MEEILLGFIAGVASRAVSTPLNIVTLRLQIEQENDGDEEEDVEESVPRVGGVVKIIYKEDGIWGFWRGNTGCCLFGSCRKLIPTRFQDHDPSIPESRIDARSFPSVPSRPNACLCNDRRQSKSTPGLPRGSRVEFHWYGVSYFVVLYSTT